MGLYEYGNEKTFHELFMSEIQGKDMLWWDVLNWPNKIYRQSSDDWTCQKWKKNHLGPVQSSIHSSNLSHVDGETRLHMLSVGTLLEKNVKRVCDR